MSKQKLEHAPTLTTIKMVEETLKTMTDSISTIPEIKKQLPKQVNHNTLKTILEYLEESNKIVVSIKGITWIYNPRILLKKEIEEGFEH